MKRKSIFYEINNKTEEVNLMKRNCTEEEEKLIELGLDKKSIEENIDKNKRVTKDEANMLAKDMREYYREGNNYDEERYLHFIREGANLEYMMGNRTFLQDVIGNDNDGKITKEEQLELTKLLLQNGADYNAVDHNKTSCLMSSVMFQNHDIFSLLNLMGADVNHNDIWGHTALYLSASISDISFGEELLKRGALIDILAFEITFGADRLVMITPLMKACLSSNIEMTKLLLENGADTSLEDSNGKTSSYYAKKVSDELWDIVEDDYSSFTKVVPTPEITKGTLTEQAKNDLNKIMKKV